MAKIRVHDLARMMQIPEQDLVFKLRSLGVRIEASEGVDSEALQAILQGKKKVELRRRRYRIFPGDRVVLYSSSPARRIVGTCVVAAVLHGSPRALYDLVNGESGLGRNRFLGYLAGVPVGSATNEPDAKS